MNWRKVEVMTWWYKRLVSVQHCKVRYSEMVLFLRETSHGRIRMKWFACSHQSAPTLADTRSAGEK
jgi:hypothetical protein